MASRGKDVPRSADQPSLSDSASTRIDPATVERKFQRAFGPAMFASNYGWYNQEHAAWRWYLFLGPLQQRIHRLARKYLDRSRASGFHREYMGLWKRRWRNLAKDHRGRRQLSEYIWLEQQMSNLLPHATRSEGDDFYQTALTIRLSGKYPKRTTHRICLDLVPGYSEMPTWKQAQARRAIHQGIKRAERRAIEREAHGEYPFRLPEGLSQRKLAACSYVLELLESLFGGCPPEINPKKLLASIKVLFAPDGGRPRKRLTKRPL